MLEGKNVLNKDYCMSSYLAMKYICGDQYDFVKGKHHRNYVHPKSEERIRANTAIEIDKSITEQIQQFQNKKGAVFLSGGMDSAIVASYFPGADAYTFRYVGIDYPEDELNRAKAFSDYYSLKLHYVDISLDSMLLYLDQLMLAKASPVYYIEPQLHQAALQARNDGAEIVMVGEGSDLVYGGLGGFLSKEWTMEEFKKVYISTKPQDVLRVPVSMDPIFEKYRINGDKIDYLGFIKDVFTVEAYTGYNNAFLVAGIPYFDPFERLMLEKPLNLTRIRNGEPKYLIRELFKMKYPDLPLPEKIRLPNPLDEFLKDWKGPTRQEFLLPLDVASFKGKNKWQLLCLERYLNLIEGD